MSETLTRFENEAIIEIPFLNFLEEGKFSGYKDEDGKPHGEVTFTGFYRDKPIRGVAMVNHGELHGTLRGYDTSGKIKVTEQYKNGLKYGHNYYYDDEDNRTVLEHSMSGSDCAVAWKEKGNGFGCVVI